MDTGPAVAGPRNLGGSCNRLGIRAADIKGRATWLSSWSAFSSSANEVARAGPGPASGAAARGCGPWCSRRSRSARPSARRRSARDRRRRLLLLALAHDLLALLDQAHHALAGLGARGRCPAASKHFVQPLDLRFGLREMGSNSVCSCSDMGRLRHLRQRLHQLLLGMQKVAQLVDQQLLDRFGSVGSRAFRSRSAEPSAFVPLHVLERRRLHELPVARLRSRGRGRRSPLDPLAGRIVEELVDERRRGRDLADENGGLPMLSSAAAKAFMCVISRVIRNCSASLVPASSQKLISRS